MTSRTTPETPVEDAAENAAAGAEPAWIEVGSPKRRTGPPAWSDEIPRDAWDGRDSADQPEQSDAPARFEVMEVQEAADGDPAQEPEGAAAADEVVTMFQPTRPLLRWSSEANCRARL